MLRFAEAEHGRVTVPEVATSCDMTIAEAKATLDRLVTQQAATIQVTQAGVLVYVFPGFLSDDDKARAATSDRRRTHTITSGTEPCESG